MEKMPAIAAKRVREGESRTGENRLGSLERIRFKEDSKLRDKVT
ncbi:hypothetical protein DHBDCA_p2537 [Dehalobacter sp. DCA]|jgi:hypothetical protein|nr:hypothetical protein DHBDCA_p2537 [Dehalobacter sp. DCA]AFV06549.1 hypothetical protein DCF50_p2546 [Dehalobacter sp. CF]